MAVRIRLSRVGATKRPSYRVVAIDGRKPRDGRSLEILGYYDPLTDPATVKLEAERIRSWIGKGAQPSDTVVRLLRQVGLDEHGVVTEAPQIKPKARKAPPKSSRKATANGAKAATTEAKAATTEAKAATTEAEASADEQATGSGEGPVTAETGSDVSAADSEASAETDDDASAAPDSDGKASE